MGDPVQDLEHELRAELPPSIAALPAEHLRHLASTLSAQRAAQLRAADEAIDEGLGFLPRVLRTVVRKALMG